MVRVVTLKAYLYQKYNHTRRYSCVTEVLQICANLKSAGIAQVEQEEWREGGLGHNNRFIFNLLQG
jgi:hypothetical protein